LKYFLNAVSGIEVSFGREFSFMSSTDLIRVTRRENLSLGKRKKSAGVVHNDGPVRRRIIVVQNPRIFFP
jgi:hypothetical protein